MGIKSIKVALMNIIVLPCCMRFQNNIILQIRHTPLRSFAKLYGGPEGVDKLQSDAECSPFTAIVFRFTKRHNFEC